jgi:hypothetical protein
MQKRGYLKEPISRGKELLVIFQKVGSITENYDGKQKKVLTTSS